MGCDITPQLYIETVINNIFYLSTALPFLIGSIDFETTFLQFGQ